MFKVSFVIEGDPVPKGRPRFTVAENKAWMSNNTKANQKCTIEQLVADNTGKKQSSRGFVRAYTPKKTKEYESLVALMSKAAMRGRAPVDVPVHITIKAFFEIPKSARKAEKQAAAEEKLWHMGRKDGDNIQKSIWDGMIGIVYKDDRQVCESIFAKKYSTHPRTEVFIWELEGAAR